MSSLIKVFLTVVLLGVSCTNTNDKSSEEKKVKSSDVEFEITNAVDSEKFEYGPITVLERDSILNDSIFYVRVNLMSQIDKSNDLCIQMKDSLKLIIKNYLEASELLLFRKRETYELFYNGTASGVIITEELLKDKQEILRFLLDTQSNIVDLYLDTGMFDCQEEFKE